MKCLGEGKEQMNIEQGTDEQGSEMVTHDSRKLNKVPNVQVSDLAPPKLREGEHNEDE
jgi:hypothetical protein